MPNKAYENKYYAAEYDPYYGGRDDNTTECDDRTERDIYNYEPDYIESGYQSEKTASWNRFLSADQADGDQI